MFAFEFLEKSLFLAKHDPVCAKYQPLCQRRKLLANARQHVQDRVMDTRRWIAKGSHAITQIAIHIVGKCLYELSKMEFPSIRELWVWMLGCLEAPFEMAKMRQTNAKTSIGRKRSFPIGWISPLFIPGR